jgi:sensor c-di-GMP phosphodiesterase-like protein
MPTVRQRIFFTVAATIIAAGCGIFAGFFFASFITVRVSDSQLEQYASRIMADGESSSAELRTVLAAMGASQHSACSGDEISYFRALIFESEFLKDAGRMRDGAIECSAALGQRAHANLQVQPDFTQQDGTEVYKSLAPYRSGDQAVITLRLGDFFVAFTPYTRMHLEPLPWHYTETAIDAPSQKSGQLLGESPQVSPEILTTEGVAQVGESLYATQCSIRFFSCFTTYTTVSEVLKHNRVKYSALIILCGLLGAVAGLLLSLLYRRNKSIEQQLRRAIRQDKLRVVYQPQVDLSTGRIVGAEALTRWTDEEGLAVGPDIFVRIAEERGFVGAITKLVVQKSLREFGETLRSHPGLHLSVNVAATDLSDPSFLPMLDSSLKRWGVQPQSLAIEITEGSTARQEVAMETIRRLRERGHKVHIDDFGTGYSSLAYLHNLSVDAIKIDRAFTQAIGTGSVIVSILPQILAMAEALHLAVIVEGVETGQQADYFASVDRTILGQGWLFGRPVPAGELRSLLDLDRKQALLPVVSVA